MKSGRKTINKNYLSITIIIVFAVSVIIAISYILYSGFYTRAKNNKLQIVQDDLIITSEKTEAFIDKSYKTLELTANSVEYLLNMGFDENDITDYLCRQSKLVCNDVDCTDLYGYINGKFVDGSSWVPGDDFVPTLRPWYIEAIKAKGKTVVVPIFIDKKTGNYIFTISKNIGDGDDVIAIDINLNDIKSYANDYVMSDDSYACIVDNNGMIVSSKIVDEIGCNIVDDIEKLDKYDEMLLKAFKSDNSFKMDVDKRSHYVFTSEVKGGWKVIVAIKEEDIMLSIYKTFFSCMILIVMIVFIIIIFACKGISDSKKRQFAEDEKQRAREIHEKKLQDDYAIINSLAGIFDYICLVNVKTNVITNYLVSGIFEQFIDSEVKEIKPQDFDEIINSIIPKNEISTFLAQANRESIMNIISNDREYSFEFNVSAGSEIQRYRIIFSMNQQDAESVIIGIKNVNDEIIAQREKEDAIYRASIDGLTGLLNKVTFVERVNKYFEKNGTMNCAMIYLDLDHFKEINDYFGHAMGDNALQEVADKLRRCFRNDEMIARLGGDEFCIFLPKMKEELILKRLEKLKNDIQKEYSDDENSVTLSCSIGCVVCNVANGNYEEITQKADMLMYDVKNSGRDGFKFEMLRDKRS